MKRSNKLILITIVLIFGFIFGSCKNEDSTSEESGPSLPTAPTGLASITKTDTSIAIAWVAVNGAVKYHVYVGTTADNLSKRGSTVVTSYLIEDLTSNSIYYIAVSAENETGEGKKSSVISVTTNQSIKPAAPTLPTAPTGLVSLTHTETTIAVSWNNVSGADKYNVYAGTVAGSLTLLGSPTVTSYLIEELTPNATYYIEVSAENQVGEGPKSAAITVTTNQSVKPAAPTGLTDGETTENSIAISWNSVDGSTGYKVFAGTSVSGMTLRGSPTETSFTITELNANTTYYISVSALTVSNESDQCASISKITKSTAPTGLAAGTITSNSIAVTWTAISGVSGYTVYAGTSSENMTQKGTSSTASSTITGLTNNTTYYIAVSAKNASGEGNQSSAITATTKLPAPGGVIATPQSASNSIQVSWNTVTGASSYKVYRSSGAAGTYTNIGTTSGQSYNDTGLTVSTDYYYKVSAITSGNVEGDQSAYVSGRILAQTKDITQFRVADFSVNGTINGTNINVTVPNIVNLTTLAPTITHNGKSISPASGATQNFTNPIQYTVTAEDNTTKNYTVTVTVTNTSLATAFTWINSNYVSSRTYTVIAQANESLAPITINTTSGVNIILSGGTTEKTISLNGNGSLFTVASGTLTLENNITLSGNSSNNASLVKVNSPGTLVMKDGSKIINNTVTIDSSASSSTVATGGGVYINGGTFTMNGGEISGNRVVATNSSSSSYSSAKVGALGGGIYLFSGTFTMSNGTISNNTAYSDKFPSAGGGVYVSDNRTFTMNGGTISGNTAQSSSVLATSYTYGGGVAAWDSSTFTMTNGTISGNTVSSADNRLGGGVYVRSDKFTKTGGTIYGSNASPTTLQNTAKDTNSGHAVYALVGSTTLKRNTTAGTSTGMDSSKIGSTGGWE